ncbi:transmembrane protein 79-like [Amphiura filiformis]|uniref:transmembrane protein 79-like n=1 Tax=Amphiura filiformis TaxID=82378 RepID=UPI003B20DB22
MSIYFYIGYYYVPITVPDNPTMIDRMIFTLQWIPIELLPMIIVIIVIGQIRKNNLHIAGDPRKSEQFNAPIIAVHVRVLANTVEQTLIHVPGLFVFASRVQPENLKLVPLLAILFFVARMIYWIGYSRNALYRGLGYAATFFPSVAMHGYALFCIVYSGATHGIQSDV